MGTLVSLAHVRIYTATHFFAVEPLTINTRNAVYDLAGKRAQLDWKWNPEKRRNERVYGKVWGGRLLNNKVFRFPISLLVEYKRKLAMNDVNPSFIEEHTLPSYQFAHADMTLNPSFQLREHQEEAIEFALEMLNNKAPSCLLEMPTGTGKTVTLAALMALLKLRTGIFVQASDVDKWIADLQKYLLMDKDEFLVIRGRLSIQRLFEQCKDGTFDKKVILFSLPTLAEFFKEYEADPEEVVETYGGTPMDLFRDTGMGLLGGDETHKSFFQVYWLNTFVHGPFHVGLSATMLHKEPFMEERQQEIYPHAKRFDKIKMKRYIRFIEYGYDFANIERDKIKTNYPGKSTYSQPAFETSILKNKRVLENFLNMVGDIVDYYYVQEKEPGDKLAYYCSLIKMADVTMAYLKNRFPQLDIRRYVEQDPYNDCIEAEVRITNRQKAGTAIDMPGLTRVITIDNVDSAQAVLQLLGRLREIKDREVLFIQLYCRGLKKHRQYKDSRRDLIIDRVTGIKDVIHNEHL